jgi:signal transduction histidine kinase/CheY-like chemotaxis protein
MKTNFKFKNINNKFSNNLPIIISIAILILSISYTINQLRIDRDNLVNYTSNSLDDFSTELEDHIENNINSVAILLLNQWINTNNTDDLYSYERYLRMVPLFYNYTNDFLAVNWINSSGYIKFVYPYERNLAAINKSIKYYPNTENEINDAYIIAQNGKIGLSRFLTFIQGGKGFACYIPIIDNGTITGYFNVVFDLNSILSSLKSHFKSIKSFSFKILENQSIIGFLEENFSLNDEFVILHTLSIFNIKLKIYAKPNSQLITKVSFISQLNTFISELFLCYAIYYLTNQLKKKNELLRKDFKEKEKLMDILYRGKKMEALGTLSGGIAHDFNNIITNMLGHVVIIQNELFPKVKDKNYNQDIIDDINYSLSAIVRNLNRSKDIIAQILAFSKQGPIEFKYINISEVLAEAVKLIQETTDKRIIFKINITEQFYIYGNHGKLLQIFMNLFINSVNAFKEGKGCIEVNCSKIRNKFSIESKNGIDYSEYACAIRIADNGIGMDQEKVTNAFDPFFSIKSTGKGTGLGLGIVYNNVIAMNGKISLKSELSKYTQIDIEFPLVRYDPSYSVNTRLNIGHSNNNLKFPNLQSKFMLMVDDEVDILFSYSKIFSKFGLIVQTFDNGIEALNYYNQNSEKIDIVLTDINLPDITGINIISEIKSKFPNQKVILMSGFTDLDIDSLNVPIIQKPFDFPKLLELLNSILTTK